MAEWLIEDGIGEARAILLDGATIAAAWVDWPDGLKTGQIEDAVLIARAAGSTRGTVRFAGGEEALADHLPRDAREGASLRMVVTRPALREAHRAKLARARPTDAAPRPAPTLAEALGGRTVARFPPCDWHELWGEAWEGAVAFAGGALTISATPAMTLIDVDGDLAPRALALAAVPPIAAAIRRFGLAGSIGIDFPTLADKADRRAVDDALDLALGGWRHERTAMNGFGFVQLVARLDRPSLLHRIAAEPAGAAARQLLRRAEMVREPGALLLTAPPPVLAAIGPDWLGELARCTGREVRRQADAGLALDAGFAQAVTP